MAHEITESDGMMYHGTTPWHGIGTSVPSLCTPYQAVHAAGMAWDVEPAPMQYVLPAEEVPPVVPGYLPVTAEPQAVPIDDRVMLIRSDTKAPLGIVSNQYQIMQNLELAEFVLDVIGDNSAAVETAGCFRGGRRVWFLLNQGAHDVAGVDTVGKFSLFAQGHDGTLAVRVLPTSVRVVCANTFAASGAGGSEGLSIPHRGDMAASVDAARHVLAGTMEMHDTFIEAAEHLASESISDGWLSHFFERAYIEAVASPSARRLLKDGRLSSLPPDEREQAERAAGKMGTTIGAWKRNFDGRDGGGLAPSIAGTRWHAFNSVTQWCDHARPSRADRMESNLLGACSDVKRGVMAAAMA